MGLRVGVDLPSLGAMGGSASGSSSSASAQLYGTNAFGESGEACRTPRSPAAPVRPSACSVDHLPPRTTAAVSQREAMRYSHPPSPWSAWASGAKAGGPCGAPGILALGWSSASGESARAVSSSVTRRATASSWAWTCFRTRQSTPSGAPAGARIGRARMLVWSSQYRLVDRRDSRPGRNHGSGCLGGSGALLFEESTLGRHCGETQPQ